MKSLFFLLILHALSGQPQVEGGAFPTEEECLKAASVAAEKAGKVRLAAKNVRIACVEVTVPGEPL